MNKKETGKISGKDLPSIANFPGQDYWRILAWILGLLGGLIVGSLVAWAIGNPIGILLGIVMFFFIRKDIEEAIVIDRGIRYYKQLTEHEPNNTDAYVQIGIWVHENAKTSHQIEEGNRFYRKALKINPQHRDAIVMLGASLLTSKKHRETVELIEQWLEGREDFMGEIIVAEALKGLSEHKRAIIHYKRALEIFPNTPKKAEIEQYLNEHK